MHPINEALLESWTPESAWWYGALLGDGHVPVAGPRGGGAVTLVGSISTTTRWRVLIAPEGPPLYQFEHSPCAFRVNVRSPILLRQLAAKGLSGPKTFSLPWPEGVPDAVVPHLVRGLWDSDGNLSIIDRAKSGRRGNPQPQANYVSVTETFVRRLGLELHRLAQLPLQKVTVVERPTSPIYRLAYAGRHAHRLADWIYSAAPEAIRNEDRMGVYLRFRELRDRRCLCGGLIYSKGRCRVCWNASIPNTTGAGTRCTRGCERPILARGLCNACMKKDRRAAAKALAVAA